MFPFNSFVVCNRVSQSTGLKDKVYRKNPYTEKELKENTRGEIFELPHEEFRRVKYSVFKRCRECVFAGYDMSCDAEFSVLTSVENNTRQQLMYHPRTSCT